MAWTLSQSSGTCSVEPFKHGHAFVGMGLYWVGEIFSLSAALHAFGSPRPAVAALIIGYATGYALTRRTLPLAGAGVVEALLPFALVWVGAGLAPAVLAVFLYRDLQPLATADPGRHGHAHAQTGSRGAGRAHPAPEGRVSRAGSSSLRVATGWWGQRELAGRLRTQCAWRDSNPRPGA